IVHAGYDAAPGSLKARFNAEGNAMMDKLCEELSVPFERIGSLVVGFCDLDMETVNHIYENGIENQIPNIKILNKEEVHKMEPSLSDEVVGALYAETGGIVGPWELAIAALENAMDNGVELFLNHKVISIEKEEDYFKVISNGGEFKSKSVINELEYDLKRKMN
ncbi:MAG: FAD-dependent oxidoreductase, partial [Neofamilia sp.]